MWFPCLILFPVILGGLLAQIWGPLGFAGFFIAVIIGAFVLYWNHQIEQGRQHRAFVRREASDRRRLNSSTWRSVRQAALRRDNYRCRKCRAAAEEVDHVLPRAMGGAVYDLQNLQSLCKPCHKAKTSREALAIRQYLDGR